MKINLVLRNWNKVYTKHNVDMPSLAFTPIFLLSKCSQEKVILSRHTFTQEGKIREEAQSFLLSSYLFTALPPPAPVSWDRDNGSPLPSHFVFKCLCRMYKVAMPILASGGGECIFPFDSSMPLKVHKIENFFDSDFGICVISLLVLSKY
jgi:hypothetical protein